jgi:outer membrane protein assembly factor BamB
MIDDLRVTCIPFKHHAMVYSKFNEVKDVFSFSINDELIAWCTKSGTVQVVNSLSLEEVWSSDVKNASNVMWCDDVLHARDASSYGANHFFSIRGDQHTGLVPEGRYAIDRFANKVPGQVVFYGISEQGVNQVGLWDKKHERPRWLVDMHVVRSFHTAHFVFGLLASNHSVTTIACLSASDGELLWQIDLKDKVARPSSVYAHENKYEFMITSLVAVHANKLTIGVEWDPVTPRLITIDCNTGSIDQYWEDVNLKSGLHARPVLDGTHILYLHGSNRFEKETQYVEIDLAAGHPVRKGIVQSLLREELVLKDWTLCDGKIYFTAIKNERFPTHVGILDYNTLDLLWWEKIAMDNDHFLQEGIGLQAYGNHFYVLDTLGTLHCFRDTND